jgi:hypothetical protein
VYGRNLRTTSALEGFNSHLNKHIVKHGNFYKFVNKLCDIEFIKSRDMAQVVDSGGVSRPVKNEQKAKNDEIKKATDDLNDNKIGVLEFLARVTCKTKKIIVDMAHFDVPNGYISDLSEDEEDGSDKDENQSSTLHLNKNDEDDGICIICADERKCVVFMPCRDMK